MNSKHRIILGDSRKMIEIDDKTVHLIITSPPYWQLKDYGSANQIGFNDSYEDYINNRYLGISFISSLFEMPIKGEYIINPFMLH